jgi:hypothetical protein
MPSKEAGFWEERLEPVDTAEGPLAREANDEMIGAM